MVEIIEGVVLAAEPEKVESDPLKISFAYEARTAAVNEACGSVEEAATCSVKNLCPACNALAHMIESRLIRAFMAGQRSMQPAGD